MSTPNWLQALARLAPTVASAFGTPIAGMAVSALESALGITGSDGSTDKIQAAIESGQLTGEQITAMKKADQDFQARMKELDVKLDELQLQDVEGARQMQVAKPSPVPAILSIIITLGFLGILSAMLAGVDVTENQAFLILIGSLGAGYTQVLNFWLGSTRDSHEKTALLAQSIPANLAKK